MEKPDWRDPQVMARWQEEFAQNRMIQKTEMMRVLSCRSPQDKRNLVAEWKAKYPEGLVNDLLRSAKNPESRVKIANWNLPEFDKQRIGRAK